MAAGADKSPAACCEHPPGTDEPLPGATRESFNAFMKNAFADGALTLENKEVMAIALSLVTKCEPCLKIHINKARSMGISQEKIDEAIMLAVAFGGAPALMFYTANKHNADTGSSEQSCCCP